MTRLLVRQLWHAGGPVRCLNCGLDEFYFWLCEETDHISSLEEFIVALEQQETNPIGYILKPVTASCCMLKLSEQLPSCHFLSEHRWLDGTPHGNVVAGSLGREGFHQLKNSEIGEPWLESGVGRKAQGYKVKIGLRWENFNLWREIREEISA